MNTNKTTRDVEGYEAGGVASAKSEGFRDGCEAAARAIENYALGYSEPTWALSLIRIIRALPLPTGEAEAAPGAGEALAQQDAQAVVQGWQPIETAPMDGRTVIIGRRMNEFGFVRGYGRFEGKPGSFCSGWISQGFDEVLGNLGLAHPTHWMPLPAPPDAAPTPPAQAVTQGPEFTDTARAALLWVLWHHQGGSSHVGQPIRFALGLGAHDHLNEQQIAEAKRWAAQTGSTTADFHAPTPPAQSVMPPAKFSGLTDDDWQEIAEKSRCTIWSALKQAVNDKLLDYKAGKNAGCAS